MSNRTPHRNADAAARPAPLSASSLRNSVVEGDGPPAEDPKVGSPTMGALELQRHAPGGFARTMAASRRPARPASMSLSPPKGHLIRRLSLGGSPLQLRRPGYSASGSGSGSFSGSGSSSGSGSDTSDAAGDVGSFSGSGSYDVGDLDVRGIDLRGIDLRGPAPAVSEPPGDKSGEAGLGIDMDMLITLSPS